MGVSLHICVCDLFFKKHFHSSSLSLSFPNKLQPSTPACPTPAPTVGAAPRPVRATSASVRPAGAARPATSVSRRLSLHTSTRPTSFFFNVCVCVCIFFPPPHLIPLAAQTWTTALQTPAITAAPARTRLMVTSVCVLRSGRGKHA